MLSYDYYVVVDGTEIACVNYADMQHKFFFYKLQGKTVSTKMVPK